MIGHAVHKSDASGSHVSCAKRCSACCPAQPVPVTAPEAFALLQLVDRQHTVPLTLALEYARRHRDELSRRFDAEPLMRQWLQALAAD